MLLVLTFEKSVAIPYLIKGWFEFINASMIEDIDILRNVSCSCEEEGMEWEDMKEKGREAEYGVKWSQMVLQCCVSIIVVIFCLGLLW